MKVATKTSTQEKLARTMQDERARLDDRFQRATHVLLAPGAAAVSEPAQPPAAPSVAAGDTWTPGMPLPVGARIKVDPRYLVDSPYNPRYYWQEENVVNIATTIARDGQLEPVKVYPPKPGATHLVIHDGSTRRRAMAFLKSHLVDCEVVAEPEDPLDGYCLSRTRNSARYPGTVLDDAMRFKQFLADGVVKTAAELAERIGEHKTYVSKVLQIASLEKEIIDAMAAHPNVFGIAAAYYVSKFRKAASVKETLALVQRIVSGKLSVRQIERLADDAQPVQAQRKPRSEALGLVKFSNADGELRTYGDGRLTLRMNGLDPAQREQLLTALLEAFTKQGLTFVHGMAPR
jgi:ParB family chromosome partitioning protein